MAQQLLLDVSTRQELMVLQMDEGYAASLLRWREELGAVSLCYEMLNNSGKSRAASAALVLSLVLLDPLLVHNRRHDSQGYRECPSQL